MIKPVQHILTVGLALAWLTLPHALAQDDKTVPAPPPVKAEPPKLNYDPTPLAPNTPSYAPVIEKVSPSVVTISTYSTGKNAARQQQPQMPRGNNQNPRFNEDLFRRFFGIPDDQQEEQTPPPQNRRRGGGNREGRSGANAQRQPLGLGSGVIVSPDGFILTNNHVVDKSDEVIVTLGSATHEYKARIVGTDESSDLAVIKIDAKDLNAVTFTDSDKLRAGDIVLAVGNPFGLTQSATMGVVSAIGRGEMRITEYENFIQTDAAINMGNSGGALVDYQGRLVGINTAIYSRTGGNQGIGFAIPANLARNVMESIIKTGKVSRGFLGVELKPLNEDFVKSFNLKNDSGALVNDVIADTPAQKAGMKNGDVIVAVNKKDVHSPRELQLSIAALPPKSKAELTIYRDGKEMSVSVQLEEKDAKTIAAASQGRGENADPDVLDGMAVGDLDPETRKELKIPANIKGALIKEVQDDSPAATAGLAAGDVILEIAKEPVTTSKQAVEISEKLKKEPKVMLRVYSKGASNYVFLERK